MQKTSTRIDILGCDDAPFHILCLDGAIVSETGVT
jgi:hypothetical protein